MIQANVDGQLLKIAPQADGWLIDGKMVRPDIKRVNKHLFHVMIQDKSFTVFIHKTDPANKTITLSINGKETTIQYQSRMDQLLKDLGMESALIQKLDSLKAPMPGLIHSISIQEGAEVKKGDPILILEAMKMENIIKSPGEGIVKKIHVSPHSSVEKNELLITFE